MIEFNMEKLPVWIHLDNVPLKLFNQKGLSYNASAIGNPLYMDRITAGQQRLAFAKAFVLKLELQWKFLNVLRLI